MNGLKSKDKIREDWIDIFKRSARNNSDFARGAERIFFWLFNQFGTPNSSPIGSDMFFETYNAFIHIDIKTAKLDNKSDYKGKIPIGKNQSSYKIGDRDYSVNLPAFYKYHEKICLTYIINIIYDLAIDNIIIKAVHLFSIPNGELVSVYGEDIYNASKNKQYGFRYNYANSPRFRLLDYNPCRIKRLFLDDGINEEDILTLEL